MTPASPLVALTIWTAVLRGIFLFMIANGAFVFVSGSRRALGIAIMTTLVWIWWEDRRIAGGSG